MNYSVPITNALPGWTGYIGTDQVSEVVYDTVSLGAAAISFQDADGFIHPLQGEYSAGLQSTHPGNQFMAVLAQVGQIPADARSLRFFASPAATIQVTFAGNAIALSEVGTGSGYDILSGDVSAYAGQIGELRFISGIGPFGSGGGGFFDHIQFSNQGVREPGVFGLSALGVWLLGWHVLRRR